MVTRLRPFVDGDDVARRRTAQARADTDDRCRANVVLHPRALSPEGLTMRDVEGYEFTLKSYSRIG